jgi:hypothetical protein
MAGSRVLGALGTLGLCVACGGEVDKPGGSPTPTESEPVAVAPPTPLQTPELPDTTQRDVAGNRLDDALDERLRQAQGDAALLAEPVEVNVILTVPLEQAELEDFVADGGQVRHAFRQLSYGFVGTIALGKLPGLAKHWGNKLHLVAAPTVVVPFLDEATRTGRVRGIWANGFAGGAGYSGNANITVAVLDTGVALCGDLPPASMRGFQDYTADNELDPIDVDGHGTHVAGIAVGSGLVHSVFGGTLYYTQSGDLSGFPAGTFAISAVHTPAYLGSGANLDATASAEWRGDGSTTLQLMSAADGTASYVGFGASTSGVSPRAVGPLDGGSSGALYQGALLQDGAGSVTQFAVHNTIQNYPEVGDGFHTMRGVASSSKWFGAKVFPKSGQGTGIATAIALDDIVSRKVTDNIKVANLSLGVIGSGTDTVFRALVNSAVEQGVVVVVAAGNDFPQTIGDPGRAAKVITVGASNDLNQVTSYTSIGALSPTATEDDKPDVLAPGGSAYRSMILAPDSDTCDGGVEDFPDWKNGDYAPKMGTSMATPFVSGSIALMIDALERSGTSWTYASSAQPLFLKMLLSASATESNTAREQSAGTDPPLGRAATPRDRYEGYGMINPDAAIEAMAQAFVSPLDGSVSNVAPARLEWERRAWGRNLDLVNGATVLLNLNVPATADYDLYLYAGTPDAKGNPVIRASSTSAGLNTDETISYVSSATETAYVFVKRVSGHGSFSLTGSAESHCGDGNLDTGELCDPEIAGSEVCCSATCTFVTDGTGCNDGNGCTQTDTCQAGACTGGNPKVCTASDSCHNAGTCAPGTGLCSNPVKMNGASCDDGNACTQTDTCTGGSCNGSNPVVCNASDQCHTAGTCATATGLCSNPAKSNGAGCDDGNFCTLSDSCQAGSCVGASPVVCTAIDPCHDAGTCDPASGVCPDPTKPNGTPCNDGSLCTQSDSCQSGTCTGANPVVCAASDACHLVGACDAASGQCSDPLAADGTACSDQGACQAGDCIEPSGAGGAGGAGAESGAGGATAEAGAGGAGPGPGAEAGAGGEGLDPGAAAGAGGEVSGPGTGAGAGSDVGGSAPGAGSSSGGSPSVAGASAAAGSGATAGAAPIISGTDGPNTSSSCGCRAPGGTRPAPSALLLLVAAAGLVRRRLSRVA